MNDSVAFTPRELAAWDSAGLAPCGRALLVRPYEPKKLSAVIEIPEYAKERLSMVEQRAVVEAIGESCWHDEPAPRCKVGDHVLIAKFAGFSAGPELNLDGVARRLVNDRDVFCRIKPQE